MVSARSHTARIRESSPQPNIVWFLRQVREQREAITDLVVLLLLSGLTFMLLLAADFTEAFFQFTRRHEAFELDEVLLVLLVVLSIYVPLFALRRWRESARRLAEANTDSLTGISNRRSGWQELELEVQRANRYGRPFSLVLFDIDRFKAINDHHGHLAGDRVLQRVAVAVQSNMRRTDTLFRWGGEEFLIICPETDRSGVRRVAERLRGQLEDTVFPDSIRLTASFGTAEWRGGDEVETLYRRVDDALYEAKAAGRNAVA